VEVAGCVSLFFAPEAAGLRFASPPSGTPEGRQPVGVPVTEYVNRQPAAARYNAAVKMPFTR